MRLVLLKILIACGVVACSGGGNIAPVAERAQPPSERISTHRVGRGDTMFSIAWRYGLDYQALARYNNIPAPYMIYPGQTLQLKERFRSAIAAKVVSQAGPKPKATSSSVMSASSSKTTSRSKKSSKPAPKKSPIKLASGSVTWQWPAEGSDIAFSTSRLNKVLILPGV